MFTRVVGLSFRMVSYVGKTQTIVLIFCFLQKQAYGVHPLLHIFVAFKQTLWMSMVPASWQRFYSPSCVVFL
jgi:hypothetical protein